MLRFIKHNLTSMLGIEIYPLFSLVLFTLFFAIVLLYVWNMTKSRVNEMSALPLELEPQDTNIKNKHL
jgi:cbb3-type cytochrome oxidase subunit 3